MDTLQAIWSILTRRQRRAALVLLSLLVVGTLLEVISIGIVMPAMRLVNGDDPAAVLPRLDGWMTRFGHPSGTEVVLGSLLAVLAITAAKAGHLLLTGYWQTRFVATLQSSLSRRLFANYLLQPWTFHLNHNSARMIRQVNEAQGFATVCSLAIATASELLVMVGVATLLLWLEPAATVVVATVFILGAVVFDAFTRGPTCRWGAARHKHAGLMLQHMQQGLAGLKDAKVLGREEHFVRHVHSQADFVSRMLARQMFVSLVPRPWFELLTVVALSLLTATLLWQGRPSRALIPTLGLFATAAFRLLPSVNRMSTSFHQLSFAKAMIQSLRHELALAAPEAPEPAAPLGFSDEIVLEGVSFNYPDRPLAAIDGIDLRVPHGAAVGLIGGSGSGKSTLVDVLLGLLPPSTGRMLVDGIDIAARPRAWQQIVGHVPQSIFLSDDTIRRNVAFGLPDGVVDDAAVHRALAAARLDDFVASLAEGIDTIVGERGVRLSGGQRQRIGIARALYSDPQVLVLDEATSSLDEATERDVMAAFESLHGTKTLIIVAHRLSTVAGCDILYRLEQGRVVQSGTYAEVVTP